MEQFSSTGIGISLPHQHQMLDRLLLFLPDLHLLILHYYMDSSTSSDGVSHNASISLLRDAMLPTLPFLSRAPI
jgi:hypothetical protein